MGAHSGAPLPCALWQDGRDRSRAAAAAFKLQDSDDEDCACRGQPVQVGEILKDDQVAGQGHPADGEGGVHPGLDSWSVSAEAGHLAIVNQLCSGIRAEAGEVQGACGICSQVAGWVVPSFRPAGEQKSEATGWHFAVARLPFTEVVDGQGVVAVGTAPVAYVDDDSWLDQVLGLEFVHRSSAGVEACGSGEVSARVLAHGEASEEVAVGVEGGPILELHWRIAGPVGDGRREGMAQ